MPARALNTSAVALPCNPVWRSYVGGRLLRAFRTLSDDSDDHFPEDWLASTVRARNGANAQHADEGLSRIEDARTGQLLIESLREAPGYWFGPSCRKHKSMGVLWKLLDSSVRLQLQAHPDAQFARRHLNSNAGKTECWYILGTRNNAFVYLGFQDPPTRDTWARMIREQNIEKMLNCFERIPVQAGDCFVIPAGTPHAIGPGVFMVELMEPTDWVVRCETVTAGLRLSPADCYMGLDLETCLDIFDYGKYPVEQVRRKFQQSPRTLTRTASFEAEELIGPTWHRFFRLHRLHGTGNAAWAGKELMLLIALKGCGKLSAGGKSQAVCAGQTWLLPGMAEKWDWHDTTRDWECLLAKLPVVEEKSATKRLSGKAARR